MAEENTEKTEKPTGRKISKAREQGSVAISQEIRNWALLLAGTAGVLMLFPWMGGRLARTLLPFIEQPDAIGADGSHLRFVFGRLAADIGLTVMPLLVFLMVVGLVSSVGQTGLIFTTEKLKFDLAKLSLLKGAKRLFSFTAILEFLKGLVKIGLVVAVTAVLVVPLMRDLELMPMLEIVQSLDRLHTIAFRLMGGTVIALTALAAIDYAYQRYKYLKDLRMTKQEVKDEHKMTEGDPMVKSRIRSIRMKRARQRMLAAVPKADVVVTNPTHFAVAMQYDMATMPAPKVVAKGQDFLALRIREIAEEHDVPIVENPLLARALYAAVEVDQEIPPQHYKAVAEVIGYVMRLKGKMPNTVRPQAAAPN
jgi:flagellar biosynthetic protein FlhB